MSSPQKTIPITARPPKPQPSHPWEPVLVRLDTVTPEQVSYLWDRRIARKKLGVILGDPGLGKSTILLDIAARISRGAAWPDGGTAPKGNTILLSAEDGLADTVRRRLDIAGADPRRITALTMMRHQRGAERAVVLTEDLPQVERAIDATHAILVLIDPLSAYLGNVDTYKDSEVRSVLANLSLLAERKNVAIVGVMHLSKGSQRPALYRGLGSIAFVAHARISLLVAPHPEDDTKRVLAPFKENICAPSTTLAYHLNDGGLVWDPEPVTNVTRDSLLSMPVTDRTEQREADQWLLEQFALAGGGVLKVRETMQAAEAEGISLRTLYRATRRQGVRKDKVGEFRKSYWIWQLPTGATPEE